MFYDINFISVQNSQFQFSAVGVSVPSARSVSFAFSMLINAFMKWHEDKRRGARLITRANCRKCVCVYTRGEKKRGVATPIIVADRVPNRPPPHRDKRTHLWRDERGAEDVAKIKAKQDKVHGEWGEPASSEGSVIFLQWARVRKQEQVPRDPRRIPGRVIDGEEIQWTIVLFTVKSKNCLTRIVVLYKNRPCVKLAIFRIPYRLFRTRDIFHSYAIHFSSFMIFYKLRRRNRGLVKTRKNDR